MSATLSLAWSRWSTLPSRGEIPVHARHLTVRPCRSEGRPADVENLGARSRDGSVVGREHPSTPPGTVATRRDSSGSSWGTSSALTVTAGAAAGHLGQIDGRRRHRWGAAGHGSGQGPPRARSDRRVDGSGRARPGSPPSPARPKHRRTGQPAPPSRTAQRIARPHSTRPGYGVGRDRSPVARGRNRTGTKKVSTWSARSAPAARGPCRRAARLGAPPTGQPGEPWGPGGARSWVTPGSVRVQARHARVRPALPRDRPTTRRSSVARARTAPTAAGTGAAPGGPAGARRGADLSR
jgi:hypothetical protein